MEYGTGDEVLAELASEPEQVSGVVTGWRRAGFELQSDDSRRAHLDDQVDLSPPALDAQVVG
jgi:hypothetical protein